MKVNVKTIWGAGLVSVASPYVRMAMDKKEDLEITCKGATIIVPFEKLSEKKPRDSTFTDKFGRSHNYTLYDFFWTDFLKGGDK